MRVNRTLTVIVPLLVCTLVASNVAAKEETRTVRASVSNASGSGVGIRAQRKPGHFTVPEGHVATGFKYHFHDPSENYTSTRLGPSNIYSVTLGREIREAEGNPVVQLSPGKYKFTVGGRPGAYGSLSFRLISTGRQNESEHQDKPGRTSSGNLRLPKNFDVTYSILDDVFIIENGVRTRLRDRQGIESVRFPETVVVQFRDGKLTSRFNSGLRQSVPALVDYRTTDTTVGYLSEGRITGTTTNDTRFTYHYEGRSLPYQLGITWSITGQVEPDGLLILHTKWLRDFGTAIHIETNANGNHHLASKPFSSGLNTGQFRTEIHLRLPVGSSPSSQTLTRDLDLPTSDSTTGPEQPPTERGPTNVDVPQDSIWSDDNSDNPWEDTAQPPIAQDDPQPPDESNIWSTEESPDEHIADNDSSDDDTEDADSRDDNRRKDSDDIADIQRRSDEKEKERSRILFKKLADSEKKAKEHGDKAKRHGDMATMHKADALGFDSLTPKDKQRLGKADDDIKDHLRGKPKTVRGYKRGIIDETMPQDMIDATHTGLKGTKTIIDESINYLESGTGTPGKIVGKTYTIVSKVAGKVSKANADYNAGKTDSPGYEKAVSEGVKEGVTDIIVDEVSGALVNGVTNSAINSKAGKRARDFIDDKVKKAKKVKAQDFFRGKTDSLNETILEKTGEEVKEKIKSKINYGVGRTVKPATDAVLKKPAKHVVDWSIDGEDSD